MSKDSNLSNINDYDDDFLDDLMNEIKQPESTPPAQESKQEEVYVAPVLPAVENPVAEKTPVVESSRPKRNGLLSGLSNGNSARSDSRESGAETPKSGTDSGVASTSVSGVNRGEQEPAAPKSGVKRKGLLSGFAGREKQEVTKEVKQEISPIVTEPISEEKTPTIEAPISEKAKKPRGLLGGVIEEKTAIVEDVTEGSKGVESPNLEVKSPIVEKETKEEPKIYLPEGDIFADFEVNKDVKKVEEIAPTIEQPAIEKEVSPTIEVSPKTEVEGYNPFKNRRKAEVKKEVPNPFGTASKVEVEEIAPTIEQKKASPVVVEEVAPIVEKQPSTVKKETHNPEIGLWEKKKEVPVESLFDEMLEDIIDDEAPSIGEKNPEVIAPIATQDLEDVIVSSDGRSLADVLKGNRSGPKSTRTLVEEIKRGDHEVKLDGEIHEHGHYLSNVKRVRREKTEQEQRARMSMKFIQRNSKFTEQEKIIMKNLGVTSTQLTQVMKSKDLTAKQKKEILGLGRYGPEKHFKGKRYKTTVGDSAMLEFLVKFRFANTRILRWLNGENQSRTWRKLNRLKESGIAESKSIIGIPDLWAATNAGVAISGYSLNPGLRPMPKMQTISSNMGVNYLAACLWFNSVNVLNLDDFPAHNRIIPLQDNGKERVQGEMLVSELEIRSSLGKEINPMSTTMQSLGDARLYDVISDNVRRAFEDWDNGGKLGESPEFQLGNEYMWVLYPTGQLTLSYHVPDLIVRRERGPNGEPRSIAVELERYEKSNDRYDKIMLAYKLDEHLYEEVVWVTPNARIARALAKAAKEVGFTRYRIVPIITKDGVYDKQDIWMI